MMVIIPCIAEIAASDTPERVKKLRLGAVSELQRYLHYYRQLGYMPKLLYAIADKKCRMIVSATTKAEMQKLIRPNVRTMTEPDLSQLLTVSRRKNSSVGAKHP